MAVPAGAAAGTAPAAAPQPAAVEERTMEIWSTPHGFIRAATANNATSTAANGGSEVTFTAGKNKYVGTINAQNEVTRVQTWIDNPVLGDTLVDTTFADYKDFGGVRFPAHITRVQGGHPVLDLTVSAVKANPAVDAAVPENVKAATAPAGRRHRREAGRRRVLPQGRHPSQPRDRSDGPYRRGRRPAVRRALAGRHRQGQGNDPEQADQVPDQHARALRPLGRPAHVGGRRRR